MNTIIGLFEDRLQAERVQSALAQYHIPASDIGLYDQSARQAAGASEQGWWESLKEAFGFGQDRRTYEEGLRRGATMVSVRGTDDAQIERVVDVMAQYGAIDIDERAIEWQAGMAEVEAPPTAATSSSHEGQQSAAMPVVQEEVQVGKRDVRRGKVRVYRQVTEQPVEQTVHLRDERVRVERRPADRPVTAEPGLFENDTIELVESAEEPVVSKQARVVEEVALRKDVQERDETIRDRVRRADVRDEREPAAGAASAVDGDDAKH